MVSASSEQLISSVESDIQTYICVKTPILTSEKYITYAIVVDTNDPSFSLKHSYVRRRYSDFVALREILVKQHLCVKTPRLPGKSLFRNRFADSFIEKRKKGLENFLNRICSVPVYLSNKALHLFLQSTFSIDEIKYTIRGNSLDFSMAVDYILNRNSRTQEVNSVGYEEFSKFSSQAALEADKQDNQECGSGEPEEVAAPVEGNEKRPSVISPAAKRVSFSNTVVVALVHTH